MDEKDFELLRVLDETRNITHAADRLYITQSALSKRIKAIERELEAEILLRSRQGIRFTPAGEAVLARSAAAARELDELRRSLSELGNEVSGTLNAGISINYAQYRLPDTLARYHKQFPKVKLHITTGQSRHLYRQLLDGGLDMAILRGEYPWDGEKFLLSQEQICVICNREFENKPLSQMLYVSHKTDPTLAGLMIQWMRENELSADQAGICVDSITTCMEMVRRGLGWGLLVQHRLPLVSFTMNIAGPVKNSPSIRRGFRLGRKLLFGQLARIKAPVRFSEEVDTDTGCEGFYLVDIAPDVLKAITCDIEDHTELGRLFDLDVLTPDGVKLDRPAPRRCLICGKPAKECARSRAHTVAELQMYTHDLLISALTAHDAESAASLAVRALLYEVCTTPKPGLVDRANSGSHRDMDVFTFMNSSAALGSYFAQCVRVGRDTASHPAPDTFAALRWPGKLAESAMLVATDGVNTHKGAIFSLGLVCAALGRLERERWGEPELILAQVAAMTAGAVARELAALTQDTATTTGQRFYLQYGVTGVRGQAEKGFPTVLEHGLPVLERGLSLGKSFDEAGAAAMLALLAHTTDTNMISRGGIDVQREKSAQLRELLADHPYPERDTLTALDQDYIRQNLSPGGSADLLALCYLLHFLKEVA